MLMSFTAAAIAAAFAIDGVVSIFKEGWRQLPMLVQQQVAVLRGQQPPPAAECAEDITGSCGLSASEPPTSGKVKG
jgi:hypothetical protein